MFKICKIRLVLFIIHSVLFFVVLSCSCYLISDKHEKNVNTDSLNRKVSEYSKILRNNPENIDILFQRARSYRKLGKYSQALNDIMKVINKDSVYTNSYYERGEMYWNLKEYDKAIHDFKIQLKINPKDIHSMHRLGYIYLEIYKTDSLEKANCLYRNILDIDSTDIYALDGLGYFYAKCCNRDSLDKAMRIYNRIIEIDPTFAHAYCSRGYIYYDYKFKNQGQNFDELALNDFKKAIELDNNFGMAYFNRAAANWALANLQEAYDDFRMAKKLYFEERESINRSLKQLKEELNTISESNKKIEKFSKRILIDPENAELYYQRGINYLNVTHVSFVKKETENDMKKKAYSDFCKYLELEPNGEFSGTVTKRIQYLKNAIK